MVAPNIPLLEIEPIIKFSHTDSPSHKITTTHPRTMLTIRKSGLSRMESKNGNASTSITTRKAARNRAVASQPGNHKLAITAGKSSNVNNCATTITVKIADTSKQIEVIFFVLGCGAGVDSTKKLMALVYGTLQR